MSANRTLPAIVRCAVGFVCLSVLPAVTANAQAPARTTIETSVLRLEVSTDPYSYRLIEKSSSETLLSEDSLAVISGTEVYPLASAKSVVTGTNTIKAEMPLQFAGREPLGSSTCTTAELSFTFVKPEILQVQVSCKGAGEISEEFQDQGEHYYGLWEYPFGGNIDNRGADQDLLGLGNPRFVHHSSARAPFYVTSRKYGIYVESLAKAHYSVAQAGKTSFSFSDSLLKYDVIYGASYAEVLERYNNLAGPAFMPPLWAFGTIWWRDDHHEDLRGVSNAQEKVIQDADRLRALHIPSGAMWLDRPYGTGEHGWGNMDFDPSFPDPARMIRDLKDRGMYLLLWTANRTSAGLFTEGSAKGYLFKADWPAAEIQRPEVYDWFKQKLDAYVRVGIRGYKIDRGEEGEMPDTMQNELSVLFPKLSAEGLASAYGNDYFVFSRNATDTARKYTSLWNGDSWSTFDGLQVSIKNGLRSGAINFPMWGSDTGGYFAPSGQDNELLARWLEFSAFSPMMEVILGPKRTLWDDYSKDVVAIGQKYSVMHHDLIPYTRSYMYEATKTGMPIMRSLIFAYPDDEKLTDTWDEYLYGRDILVAPIATAGTTERKVYLPAGRWMNYNDRQTVYDGKSTISAAAPLDTIPLFVREGAIIPRGDIVKLNNNWDANWSPKLTIEVFPARNQPSRFEYFTGNGVQEINVKPEAGGLTIQLGNLGTKGTVNVYCGRASAVTRNGSALKEGPDYHYDAQARVLSIPVEAATTLVIKDAASLF